jgi:hypothetical protein
MPRIHPLRAGSLECRPDKKRKRRNAKKRKNNKKQADPAPTSIHGGLPSLGKRH